jgi:hypothetical protein
LKLASQGKDKKLIVSVLKDILAILQRLGMYKKVLRLSNYEPEALSLAKKKSRKGKSVRNNAEKAKS